MDFVNFSYPEQMVSEGSQEVKGTNKANKKAKLWNLLAIRLIVQSNPIIIQQLLFDRTYIKQKLET